MTEDLSGEVLQINDPEQEQSQYDKTPQQQIGEKRKIPSTDEPQTKVSKAASIEERNINLRDTITMFCKNLSFKVTEDELRDIFKKNIGVQIAKNKDNLSRGYAFVCFATEEDLQDALKLKTLELYGRVTELKRAVPDDQGGATSNTLYIRGVTQDMTEDYFRSKFDGIIDVRLSKSKDMKGFCHIEFNSVSLAEKVYKSTRGGLNVNGNLLEVKYAAKRSTDTLHIKGITRDMSREDVLSELNGAIDVRLSKDQYGQNLDYCFVQFQSEELAEEAYQLSKIGLAVNGKIVEVSYANSTTGSKQHFPRHQQKRRRSTLFIGGLTDDITEDDIRDHFYDAVNVRIIRRFRDVNDTGYGFVDFDDYETADQVFRDSRNGLFIKGIRLRVRYAKN